MRQSATKLVLLFIFASTTVVFFQNCGKSFNTEQNALASSGQAALGDSTPFAFDASFDQISYNSCFGPTVVGKEGFFSIFAGSYTSRGGISVKSDFMTYAKTSGVIKPAYPATEITDLQIKQHLFKSPANAGSQPQAAIRTRGKPQEVLTPSSETATEMVDYFSLLGMLTDDRWMDPLIKSAGNYMTNYFNLAPGGQRLMEARFVYNKDEGLAQGLREAFRSTATLGLTFKNLAENGPATSARMTPSGSSNVVYGRAYNLTFESAIAPFTRLYNASPMPHILNPNNILTHIQEVNLENNSQGATWTCHESRRYLIVRPQDATHCPKAPYSYMISGIPARGISAADYRAELEVVRRHLKPEFWDVNVEYKCAIPKEGSCYHNEVINGVPTGIEYDQQQPCYQALPDIPYGNPLPIRRCAQYVSICTRN